MNIERGGGSVNVFVSIESGPPGWDPATTTAEVAIVAPGTVPGAGDWHAGTWQGEKVRYLIDPGDFADGDYLIKVRLSAGLEQVPLTSGRLTIG